MVLVDIHDKWYYISLANYSIDYKLKTMNTPKNNAQFHQKVHQEILDLFQLQDTSGIEIFVLLRRLALLSGVLESQAACDPDVSCARWRVLLRLMLEDHWGNSAGLTPSEIAHFQHVSRNTISSLLRGLENQGMIQRLLDPEDLRVFRIQLTAKGRDYILQTAPGRLNNLNQLVDGLSAEERHQLTDLLGKLLSSLLDQLHGSVVGQNE